MKISSKQVVTTSLVVDFSDLVLNITVAVLSGSVVLAAEALQGGVDLITSGLIMIGLRRSHRRSNRRYPFGYGREIYFWSLMAGTLMLTFTAGLSMYFGWQRIITPRPIDHLWLGFTVLIIALTSNGYAFYLSARRLRENHESGEVWRSFLDSNLIETKVTFVLDAMGTVAAFYGLVALTIYQLTGDPRFDGLGAVIIGITIGLFAFFLVSEVRSLIVGRSAGVEIEAAIKAAALEVEGVRQILDLRTMYIGSERLLVNMEVDMKQNLKTNVLEQRIDEIKANVQAKVPSVHHIQVELETSIK